MSLYGIWLALGGSVYTARGPETLDSRAERTRVPKQPEQIPDGGAPEIPKIHR